MANTYRVRTKVADDPESNTDRDYTTDELSAWWPAAWTLLQSGTVFHLRIIDDQALTDTLITRNDN